MSQLLAGALLLLGQASQAEGRNFVRQEYVRTTFYTVRGITASGEYTRLGVAACSDWLPLGTRLAFSDGMVVTCLDRGLGGKYWDGWVDVWAPSYNWGVENVQEVYGDYSWVTVLDSYSD